MKFKKWLNKLKKELRKLPQSEIDEALRYYQELYADKRDMGMREAAIIAEFGSPEYAAEAIKKEALEQPKRRERREERPAGFPHERYGFDRYEYHYIRDGADRELFEDIHNAKYGKAPEAPLREPRSMRTYEDGYRDGRASAPKKRGLIRTLFKIIFGIATALTVFIAAVVTWSVVAACFFAGLGMSLGGLAQIVISLSAVSTGVAWLPALGSGLFLAGFGFVFGWLFIKVAVKLFKATKKACVWVFRKV